MIGGVSGALLGAYLPESGLQSILRDSRLPLAANSFFPEGVAIAEDCGYRLNGRWRLCSGIRHAEVVLVGAVIHKVTGRTRRQGHRM
jgi:hypothetical protein